MGLTGVGGGAHAAGMSTNDPYPTPETIKLDEFKPAVRGNLIDWLEANPEAAWLAESEIHPAVEGDRFIVSLRDRLRKFGFITERQATAAQRVLSDAIRQAGF